MKTRRYVSLGIWSDVLAPSQIAAVVGLEPGVVLVEASRRLDPPMPVGKRWTVECRDLGVQVGDQVERLVERLRPHAEGL